MHGMSLLRLLASAAFLSASHTAKLHASSRTLLASEYSQHGEYADCTDGWQCTQYAPLADCVH